MRGSLYRVQFIRVMCRRCSHVGCVERGRLVVGTSRPSHHGTTSYFAQLAGFSLDHETTLQQRFLIPSPLPSFLPSLLSFEAGGIVAFRLHLAHIQLVRFLFLRLETDLVECRTRDTIRFPVLFFIARRNWIGKFGNRVSSTLRFLGCFRSLEAVWV